MQFSQIARCAKMIPQAETMPMAGEVIRSSGRSPHFNATGRNKLMQGPGARLAIEG
jgi:hypothetical protein